jgi:hypothetical protein
MDVTSTDNNRSADVTAPASKSKNLSRIREVKEL